MQFLRSILFEKLIALLSLTLSEFQKLFFLLYVRTYRYFLPVLGVPKVTLYLLIASSCQLLYLGTIEY